MTSRLRLSLAAILVSKIAAVAAAVPQIAAPEKTGEFFVVDDFDFKVTNDQAGLDFFGGNMGLVSFPPALDANRKVAKALVGTAGGGARLQVDWDFTGVQPAKPFVGYFMSLFGLTDAKVRLGANREEPAKSHPFPKYSLNFDNFFGSFLPLAGRSIENVDLTLAIPPSQAATGLKIELKDEQGRTAVARVTLVPGESRALRLARAAFKTAPGFTWKSVNTLAVVAESLPPGLAGGNPVKGSFFLDDIMLEDADGLYPDFEAMAAADGTLQPQFEEAFLKIVRERSFQYFIDFDSKAAATGGTVQDRSTSADLMTVGGAGFQIAAYIMGAERGYLARPAALDRVRKLLRVLALAPQGPQERGRSGYKGFFYHFLGVDGRRKLNFDFAFTEAQEDLNTVELSTIDTSLFLCGVLAAERYFSGPSAPERELRTNARKLFARVDWTFMFDREQSKQLALGWKPNETRDDGLARFLLPDQERLGDFSSKMVGGIERAATLDYYTDEGILAAILAMAAPNPAFRLARTTEIWDAIIRDGTPFVKSFGGPLFTGQFGAVFLNTAALGADNHQAVEGRPARPVDFAQNTQAAIAATRDYAIANPLGHATLDALDWGLTAIDGPFGAYHAYAAPTAAAGTAHGLGLTTLTAEGEAFAGAGTTSIRTAASGQATRYLHSGGVATFPLNPSAKEGVSQINVTYSNDGPADMITVLLDGTEFGHFTTENTRPAGGAPGDGWNNFRTVTLSGARSLSPGTHAVAVQVSNGDPDGVEIDLLALFSPLEDGTVAPYAVASSLPFLPAEAVAALWHLARLNPFGHPHTRLFHPRFGFGDAFNAAIEDALFAKPDGLTPLRTTGPWLQMNGFAIDHGPMCLLIDRYLDGPLIQKLFMGHPLVQPVLQSLFPAWVPPAP